MTTARSLVFSAPLSSPPRAGLPPPPPPPVLPPLSPLSLHSPLSLQLPLRSPLPCPFVPPLPPPVLPRRRPPPRVDGAFQPHTVGFRKRGQSEVPYTRHRPPTRPCPRHFALVPGQGGTHAIARDATLPLPQSDREMPPVSPPDSSPGQPEARGDLLHGGLQGLHYHFCLPRLYCLHRLHRHRYLRDPIQDTFGPAPPRQKQNPSHSSPLSSCSPLVASTVECAPREQPPPLPLPPRCPQKNEQRCAASSLAPHTVPPYPVSPCLETRSLRFCHNQRFPVAKPPRPRRFLPRFLEPARPRGNHSFPTSLGPGSSL